MIEIKDLGKSWNNKNSKVVALHNINLSISKGEFITIIGPSGCGKTTLLKIIAKLTEPQKGEILFQKDEQIKSSFVFQKSTLLPWKNIYQNVSLPWELDKRISKKEILKKISLVGLDKFKKNYPYELSGGMQQRVALARALVSNPELLLMDEPFGALDEINRNKLNLDLLKIQRKLNSTILFVTHSISEAVFLADRVVILSKSPARIKEIIEIDLPRKRTIELKETSKFQEYVRCIRKKLN